MFRRIGLEYLLRSTWWILCLPFRFLWAAMEAWRDVQELSRPYSYSDSNWHPYQMGEVDEAANRTISTPEYDYARYGKCDLCEREVWYKIVYSSAGIPVATLLCFTCAYNLVSSSPHILVCHITAQRDRYCREKWEKGER